MVLLAVYLVGHHIISYLYYEQLRPLFVGEYLNVNISLGASGVWGEIQKTFINLADGFLTYLPLLVITVLGIFTAIVFLAYQAESYYEEVRS